MAVKPAAHVPDTRIISAVPLTVVIASRQRSGSTILGQSICDLIRNTTRGGASSAWFLDEPWLDARERPANRNIEVMVPWPVDRRLKDPLGYIRALRSARCRQLHQSMRDENRCDFTIVVKLFDIHYAYSSLHRPTASLLRPLFSDPSSRMVVLERDPSAQRCSLLWAEKSHHWWLPDTPEDSRRAYEAFKRGNCSSTSGTLEARAFARHHEQWFAQIHEALLPAPGASRRAMNATYDEVVTRHSALLERIQKQLLV